MKITCDCGGEDFAAFGPYSDSDQDDPGLRRLWTCLRCGEQVRLYQTGPAWRERVRLTEQAIAGASPSRANGMTIELSPRHVAGLAELADGDVPGDGPRLESRAALVVLRLIEQAIAGGPKGK